MFRLRYSECLHGFFEAAYRLFSSERLYYVVYAGSFALSHEREPKGVHYLSHGQAVRFDVTVQKRFHGGGIGAGGGSF